VKIPANFLIAALKQYLRPYISRNVLIRFRALIRGLLKNSNGKHGKISTAYFISLDVAKFEREMSLQEKIDYIGYQFFGVTNYNLDIFSPKTFCEKMQWLKVFYENPLLTVCADKYRVREYVEEKISADLLVPLIGVYDSPEEIDFDILPNQFVMKVNWGSGLNIICKDKTKINVRKTKNALSNWLRKESNHYYYSFEFAYKNIVPKIMCEQYIEQIDGELLDYKFFCFNGIAKYVQVDFDRHTNHIQSFYDREWKKLNFTIEYPQKFEPIPKPEYFDEMLKISEKLSQGFVFVRVDLYHVDAKIYFGELTFYPGTGMYMFNPSEWDEKLGEPIILPQKLLSNSSSAV
jgi:hypothetical protein